MAKVKVQCIEKTRDRVGNITQYVIKDEYGKVDYLNRDQMLKMLKNKNYEVVNLQIDKAGRIVDKAVELEKVAQGNNVQKALELSYQMLAQGKDIGFGSISYNGKTWDLLSEKRINNILSAGGQKIYPIDFVNTFQNYICKRGGLSPYCLHVKSKDGAVDMFNFCINNSEILLKGFIQEYADGYEKYLKPENYMIEAYRVDNSKQSVNTYVEPDMSLVGTGDKSQKIEKLTLNKKNEYTDDLTLALTNGLDLLPVMYNTEYLNKLQSKCEELISNGYMFTHMYSRHTGKIKYNYIIFYTKKDTGTVDRKIYTTIENMINSYSSVSEAVQDLEMKDTRFGIVDLLDDAIIHAFGDEVKIQNYIKQQLNESNSIDCNSLLNYIFRNINMNRLYDYGNFSRRRSYNEFNNQYRKVVKQQRKKSNGLVNRVLKIFNLENSILGMYDR